MDLTEKIALLEQQVNQVAQDVLRQNPVYQNLLGRLTVMREIQEEEFLNRHKKTQEEEEKASQV